MLAKLRLAVFGLLWSLMVLAHAQVRNLPDFADLAEQQGPSVVNISTTTVIRPQASPFANIPGMPGLSEDDPAYDLFRHFFRGPGVPGQPRQRESKSLGSGFIISGDGYILTNAHVVAQADEITVRLTDKREFKAKVIGSDRRTDVALIKIEASNLPKVTLGDPARLRVGEWVIAIGSPFGFDNSVTAGIVSAKGRELPQENLVPFIQTDVAINPGNSGGPLFNMRGEVVGINSQIYSRSGGYMGLSFAIPIDVAMDIQNQLRTTGRVTRGRIGVVIQEMGKDLAESFGLPKPVGALVNALEPNGPAAKGGVQAGDIILKVDGKPVNQSSDLPRLVTAIKPGSKIPLQIWRTGSTQELSVIVAEAQENPADRANRQPGRPNRPEATVSRLGLILSEAAADPRLKLDHGLVVEDVRGTGDRGDLRPKDVLMAVIVKGVTVDLTSVAQFNDLLADMDKTAPLTLLVRRGSSQLFVILKPGK